MRTTAVLYKSRSVRRSAVGGLLLSTLVLAFMAAPTQAADEEPDPTMVTWSTVYEATQTVKVTETATVDGFEATGSASATATATATGTATAPTWWEVYYLASVDAYEKANAQAKADAEAIARPLALDKAKANAQALADAAKPKTWSTVYEATQTVKVTETATVDGFEATGSASATATATATGTATAPTWWEVYYFASVDAYEKANAQAKADAEAIARPLALEKAQANAQALADAAKPKTWTTEQTVTETVTVTETAEVDGFEGEGTASATATATRSGTATADTWWEVNYLATFYAYLDARDAAWQQADDEARPIAYDRALADAQAKADAAQEPGDGEQPDDSPTCGAEVLKEDGSAWDCTFAEEFRGDGLDPANWTAITTEHTRFHYGDCFVGEEDGVEVRDGALRLSTEYHDEAFTCNDPTGAFETNYTSGSVTSLGKFSQTYGRFAIRAAMPEGTGPGMGAALWLVPDEPTYYGGWPGSGEIDIAEFFSGTPDRLIPSLHYNSLIDFSKRTNNYCFVHNPTAYHTYVLEWTDRKIKISIDGNVCLEHTLSPLPPLTNSAPFDRPFNINLTQTLGSGKNAVPEGERIDSATLSVDYVRAWS